jgi:hypothetical protein
MGRMGLLLLPTGQARLEFGVFFFFFIIYFGCLKFACDGDKHLLVADVFGDLLVFFAFGFLVFFYKWWFRVVGFVYFGVHICCCEMLFGLFSVLKKLMLLHSNVFGIFVCFSVSEMELETFTVLFFFSLHTNPAESSCDTLCQSKLIF